MPRRTTLKIHTSRMWRLCTVQCSARAKGMVQAFSRQQITILYMSCLHTEVGKALKVPALASLGTWLCVSSCLAFKWWVPAGKYVRALSQLPENMPLLHPAANNSDHLQCNKPSFASAGTSLTCSRVQDFASATCCNGCASITGRYSDTGWLKAVETMGKKEKSSEGKHLFSLPLATSGTFLITERLEPAEVVN